MARQKRFKAPEEKANSDYAHVCNLEKTLFEEEKRGYKKLAELHPPRRPCPSATPSSAPPTSRRSTSATASRTRWSRPSAAFSAASPRVSPAARSPSTSRASFVTSSCAISAALCGHPRVQSVPVHLRAGVSAGDPVRSQCVFNRRMEAVAIGRLERFVGDYAADADGRAGVRGPAGARRYRRLRARRPRRRRRSGAARRRGHRVRGPARRRRRPSLRHPVVPAAARHHRARGGALEDMGVRFEVNKVVGRTFTLAQLLDGMGFTRCSCAPAPARPRSSAFRARSPGRFTQPNELPHPRQPHGRRPLPVSRHAHRHRQSRRRHRGRQHRHGLPAGLQASRRATGSCVYRRTEAEAPARVGGASSRPRRGRRLPLPARAPEVYADDEGNVRGVRSST